MIDHSKEQIIDYIEEFYCGRMISLVEENRIADADALHEEFEISEKEFSNFNWMFLTFLQDVS